MSKSQTPCKCCGAEGYSTAYYLSCKEKQRMDRDGICFDCAFWDLRAENPPAVVIDGFTYSIGNRPKGGEFNGMGGRRFDIEFFDGRRVTTYDLWAGGQIPERLRERMPDTARFLNGAGMVTLGDTTCWNGSAA